MSDDELRAEILGALDMKDVPEDMQQEALYRVEAIANERLAAAIPDLLNEEQQAHFNAMYDENKSGDEIIEWVHSELPQLDDAMRGLMIDVANEVAEDAKK